MKKYTGQKIVWGYFCRSEVNPEFKFLSQILNIETKEDTYDYRI